MNAWEIIKRLFVVHKCASCRKILGIDEYEQALCRDCTLAYQRAKTENCPDCLRAAFECTCQPRLLTTSGSLCMRKLFFYHPNKDKEPQNRLIYSLKRHPRMRATYLVAKELYSLVFGELCEIIERCESFSDAVAVVSVPRTKRAVLEYGFDQAVDISEVLADMMGVPYVPVIKRRAGGREQKKLSAAERRKNMKDSMFADPKYIDAVKGRYIVLVDDVVTTGSSMEACLKILRKMGVRGVICCCLAADANKKSRR